MKKKGLLEFIPSNNRAIHRQIINFFIRNLRV
jgi:hypothetical protein